MKEINISAVLSVKRKEKGITQEQLAHYMGVSKASVSKWETGQSYPDITFLPQLAAYFDITIDELIDYHPQMTKEDIKILYHRLAEDFAKKDIEEVLVECRELIRKYYSCYPLLLQMGVLFLNHIEFLPEKKEQLLNDSIDLCRRIREEAEDISIIEMAVYLQSICLLGLNQPQEVESLLENTRKPFLFEELLLSSAYAQLTKMHEAEEIIQVKLYQYLIGTINTSMVLMQCAMNDVARFDEIIDRTKAICLSYDLVELHPHTMFGFYLTAAQGYTMQERPEKALEMLEQFVSLWGCQFKLHGDDFFTKIDSWLEELELGVEPPRNSENIKQSLISCIENPIYSPLFDYPEYQKMVRMLKLKLQGGQNE